MRVRVLPMAEWVRLIDGNYSDRPVGYCKSKKGHLTKKLMETHKCHIKKCTGFEKIDCEYWRQKQRKKDAKKQRKTNSRELYK